MFPGHVSSFPSLTFWQHTPRFRFSFNPKSIAAMILALIIPLLHSQWYLQYYLIPYLEIYLALSSDAHINLGSNFKSVSVSHI